MGALVPLDPQLPAVRADEVPDDWGLTSPKRAEQIAKARRNQGGVKHGILSTIPMECRAERCPYASLCSFQLAGEVVAGERCVLEIGRITESHDRYLREFKLDPLDPEMRADLIQVQQLISMEVMMGRAEMALAKGNLIEDVEVAMNPQGDVITQPMLHKAAEFLPKIQRRHNEILQLLLATRKDKLAAEQSMGMSVADFTKDFLQKAQTVAARQALMREGKHKEAEDMGFKYGLDSHITKEDILDAEFTEKPPDEPPAALAS